MRALTWTTAVQGHESFERKEEECRKVILTP